MKKVSPSRSPWSFKRMTLPTNEQVRRDFRRIIEQRPDIGSAKMIANCVSDPPHIFDPHGRRQPKPEFVIVVAYVVLMALVSAAFNW